MAELKLKLDAPGLSLVTADAAEVLRVLASYLETVRRVALAAGAKDPPVFAMPVFTTGSVGCACEVRTQVPEARRAAADVQAFLKTPAQVPLGVRTQIADFRAVLLDVPDDVSVVVNGLTEKADLTALVRGANRPTTSVRETMRARVVRTGGRPRSATVRFESQGEGEFTLRASEALAREAGLVLYHQVELEAEVVRAQDSVEMPILRGRLWRLQSLADGPTLDALRSWYAAAHPEGVPLEDD